MPAYLIVDIDVTDPVRYEDYKKLGAATLEPYGGKYRVRGGAASALEGDWNPGRVVVIEFPSEERARAWWSSREYAPAKAIRQAAARTRMILVPGV
jgi:uncharacterized protein (DUF1330 family)